MGADTITAAATGTGVHSDGFVAAQSATPTEKIPRAAPQTLVLPAEPPPRRGVGLIDVGRQDVAPVQRVVTFRSPALPLALCLVLALAAVGVALLGLGTPPRGGDLRPGTVTIAGVDPTGTDTVVIDMTKPIPITVSGIDGDTAGLSLDVLGVPVGQRDSPLILGGQGLTAAVPPPVNPYVLAGRITGEVTIRNGPTETGTYRFGIRTTQPATTTAVAVITVLLALFAGAYAESFVRALRRGRSRVTGYIGLPAGAAGLAVSVVGAVWVLLGREPTVKAIVGSAVLAAAAGIAATVAASRIGRKYRHRRKK
jgi:serine/threonine-protein kinase